MSEDCEWFSHGGVGEVVDERNLLEKAVLLEPKLISDRPKKESV